MRKIIQDFDSGRFIEYAIEVKNGQIKVQICNAGYINDNAITQNAR